MPWSQGSFAENLLNSSITFIHTLLVLQHPGCAALGTQGDKPWKSTTTRVTLGYVRVRELLALWEDAAAQGWESALLFQGNGVKHFLQSTE